MWKKLVLSAVAVVILAVAAPAADAESIVTDAEGNDATNITAESTDLTIVIPGGAELSCDEVKLNLHGGTGHYSGTGSSGESPTSCEWAPIGLYAHFSSITATIQPEGGGFGLADFTFSYQVTGFFACHYTATESEINYTPTKELLAISGLMISKGFCPGETSFAATFRVLDSNQFPVSIH